MTSGRANFTRGNLFAMNLQAGSLSVETDGSGDGTVSVTFAKPMNGVPEVVLTAKQALITGTLSYSDASQTGFIAKVDGANVTSGTVSVSYMAYDDQYF